MIIFKKNILSIGILLTIISSCKKRQCKDEQAKKLPELLLQYQKQTSDTNLTVGQLRHLRKIPAKAKGDFSRM